MANPRKLRKIEPYNPNAFDGDNDGIVQDGTAWERPAGVRIFDRSGQEIMPGRISETPVSDLIYRNNDGSVVDFKPKFEKESQDQQKPGGPLGNTLKDRAGTIGQDRTLGDKARQQKERETAREQQRLQQEQQAAAAAAAQERRDKFAEIIENLPIGGPNDPDPFVNIDNDGETVETATAKANLVFGLLGQALALKADPSRVDESPDIDPDRLDAEIEWLNLAAKAMFGMNIEGPINEQNAGKYAQVVANLNEAFGKSIRDQALVSKYIDDIDGEPLKLDGSGYFRPKLDNASIELLQRMEETLRSYSGFAEAADTAENTSFEFDQNQAQIARQLRDQHFKYLVANDKLSKIEKAQKKLRNTYYNKISENWAKQQDGSQGVLNTLYPGIELQPNDPSLGNTTQLNPNPENPLPVPINNGLNIEVDIDDFEPGSDMERAAIIQAGMEHMRNGGSLSDIPNDYWIDVLSASASDAEIDTDNPFYEIIPDEGAISFTRIYWRRNPDGSPSDQGWVTKAQPWSVNAADHSGWNIAAALGIFPEGSNWGGSVGVEPSDATDWLEEMPVIVAPIVWNHLPTNGDLSRIDQNRSYQHGEPGQGAAKRHLAAILHTWLIGDEDRNPGNTMSGHLDGETYIFPIDFGSSGGFQDRRELPDYIGIGKQYGNYGNYGENVQAHRQTLTPEQRRKFDQEMVDTYDSMLQRAEQLLRNNSEEEFIQTMLPQNIENYPEMNQGMMRRELAAVYGGFENGTRLMRQKRDSNLKAILGDDYDKDDQDDVLFELSDDMAETEPGQPRYTPERLQSTLFTGEEPTAPTVTGTAKSLTEVSDATPEELLEAIDTLKAIGYSYLVSSVKDQDEIRRDIANGDREEGFKVLLSHFYDSWNISNTEPNSLVLSQIAREELEKLGIGLGPEYTKYWGGDVYDILKDHPVNQPGSERTREIIAEAVKAHYQGIQKYFKDNDITEIRVFRGMTFSQDDKNPFDSLPRTGEIELEQRTLSSWAYDSNEASSFARMRTKSTTGVILHDIVPVEQVFSITTKDQGSLGEATLGSVGEREVVVIGVPRQSQYFVNRRDDQDGVNITPQGSSVFQTLDQIDAVLLNSNETGLEETNNQPPSTPQPLQTRTAKQLKDADYRQKKGAAVTSPSIGDIADLAAEDADFTAQEAFDALQTLGRVSRIEFIPFYNTSQAEDFANQNDLAQIYVSVLTNISQSWNSEVTSPISRFFTQLVKEELSESFGIEFGPDHNVRFDEPGTGPNFDTPETEQGRQVIKKLINAQYKATQEHLAVEGITEVRAYRGITAPSGPGTDFPETNGTNQINMRPISSWTHDYRIVGNFIDGEESIILHTVFPAENIFSIRPAVPSDVAGSSIYMGIGDSFESEIVPLHTNMPYDYIATKGIDISNTDLDEILTGEKEWDPNNFNPTFDRQSRTAGAMGSQEMAEYESEAQRGDTVLNLDDAKFYTWDGQKWLEGQQELQPE